MNKERFIKIKENVYIRCNIATQTGIGLTSADKEELELINEIDQLTNNWNELEEWLKEQLMYFNENNGQSGFSTNIEDLEMVLDKMKEIKERNNEINK